MISNQVEMYLSEKKKTYLSDPILIFPNPPTPRIALSLPPSSNAHPHPSMYNVCVNSIDQYCPDVGDVLNLIPPCREWENVHYIKPIAILVKDEGGQRLPEAELDVVGFVAGFTPDHDYQLHSWSWWRLSWSWSVIIAMIVMSMRMVMIIKWPHLLWSSLWSSGSWWWSYSCR